MESFLNALFSSSVFIMSTFDLKKINNLIFNNYLKLVDKSIKSQFHSLFAVIKWLFVARVFYVRSGGQSEFLFWDFDNRKDHMGKIEAYCHEFNFKFITIGGIDESNTQQKIVMKLPLFKLSFYQLFKYSWNESKKNDIPFLIFIEALMKYINYYLLGLNVSKMYSPAACISLNFALVPGFTEGLKGNSSNIKVISIQHGFVADGTNDSNNSWKDYFSDYYVFWNHSFKGFYQSKLNRNCTSLVYGNPEYFSSILPCQELNGNLKAEYEYKKILFLSSYSTSADIQIIHNEWETIAHLKNIAEFNKAKLTVRYHPSISPKSTMRLFDDSKTIDFQYSTNTSLSTAIETSDIVITCNSTAIVQAFLKCKPCVICQYVSKNILNVNFPILNVTANNVFDLEEVVNKYSVTSTIAIRLLYGEETDEFDALLAIIKTKGE